MCHQILETVKRTNDEKSHQLMWHSTTRPLVYETIVDEKCGSHNVLLSNNSTLYLIICQHQIAITTKCFGKLVEQ